MSVCIVDDGPEYDQVREHRHGTAAACWCGFGVGSKMTSADAEGFGIKSPVPVREAVAAAIPPVPREVAELNKENYRLTSELAREKQRSRVLRLECRSLLDRLIDSQDETNRLQGLLIKISHSADELLSRIYDGKESPASVTFRGIEEVERERFEFLPSERYLMGDMKPDAA